MDDAITVFGRFLRQAGCTVGPREIMSAIEASSHIEIHKKQDFKQALQATLISNNKNLYLFNHLFDIFWKNPDKLNRVSSILKKLNKSQSKQLEIKSMKEEIDDIYRKRDNSLNALDNKDESEVKPLDLSFYSPNELLKKKRFDSYTNQELEEAKKFADAIHKKYPGKLLAYNCSPSFNWKKHLSDNEIATFQKKISEMGYKFQFITLAGFHTQNIAIFELAEKYKKEGMTAYSRIQQQEFSREKDGYTSVKHQREVGTSYFDAVSNTISGGKSSTTAMKGSTESEQF